MRILMPTDAFPPVCGGSGWSTYELAKGLRARGHTVLIVCARAGRPRGDAYDGFQPVELPVWAPPVPFARNYFRNERLYPRFGAFLGDLIRRHGVDLVHAQHVLSGPSGVAAARQGGVPSVCTVRDYWPVCYWSTLIHDPDSETLCPGCSAAAMTRCIRPRAGALWPLALPLIPYMRSNLALKRGTLAQADAVVAVSGAIARDLRARAPELGTSRLETIPNPVDLASIRAHAAQAPRPMAEPYAIYVGKLEPNKGVSRLIVAARRARLARPLVVVGDGSQRMELENQARQAGCDVRFLGWRPREEALGWLRHAELLIFPSHGPESLSRVLLEASALGVPIAANDTGGTGDIVVHEETGLLSRSGDGLGEDVARLLADPGLRARLGEAARRRVEGLFDAPRIVERMERLYGELIDASACRRTG